MQTVYKGKWKRDPYHVGSQEQTDFHKRELEYIYPLAGLTLKASGPPWPTDINNNLWWMEIHGQELGLNLSHVVWECKEQTLIRKL